jgi:hypothetical protein
VTDEKPTCLPCYLADYHGDGAHDCNGEMKVWDGLQFVTVTCSCPRPDDHPPKTTTPTLDPNRGDGG